MYVYKTADQLIAKGSSKKKVKEHDKSKHAQVKVIDMTGKEQRVLTGTKCLNSNMSSTTEL